MPPPALAKKTLTGRIIAGGGLIVLALLLAAWWRAYHAPKEHLVLYFAQSIQGIDVGTPVKIMGVAVGHIEQIEIGTPDSPNHEFCPAVHLILDGKKLKKVGMPQDISDPEVLKKEIDGGLRAKLTLSSPLQGDYFINLVFEPNKPAIFFRSPESNEPEVPVINTSLDPAIENATKFLQKFSQTNFAEIERHINDSLDELQTALAPENFERFNHDAITGLEKAQTILDDPALKAEIKNVNNRLEEIRTGIQKRGVAFLSKTDNGTDALTSLRNSLKKIETQTQEIGALLDIQSPNMRNVRRELRKLLSSIEDISSTIQTPFRLAVPATSETSKFSPTDQSGK